MLAAVTPFSDMPSGVHRDVNFYFTSCFNSYCYSIHWQMLQQAMHIMFSYTAVNCLLTVSIKTKFNSGFNK